jgi:acetyl esterase/lipase
METQITYLKQTFVYKTVQNCHIHADVYRTPGEDQRPVILWIHGGALIFGDRSDLPREQLELYLTAGYTIVSIDYRLAPETKLQAIIEDVRDAYNWVIRQGPGLFSIDPDRLAVIGHSAGGYLSLMTGFIVQPRPKAIVSFYGYGDIIGDWYSRPDPHYNLEPAISPEIAYQGVGGTVITGSQTDQRWLFYLYCRQQGLWPKEVTGFNPFTEMKEFEQYCPVRNVTQDYPPTLLLHGDEDTDVPFEQSVQMAAVLREHQVVHQLITMKGFGHAFDILPDGLLEGESLRQKRPEIADAFDSVLVFLNDKMVRYSIREHADLY